MIAFPQVTKPMPARTTALHVRIDESVKEQAGATLAGCGLTVSDAVGVLLTRLVQEGGLPPGLTADPGAHNRR